MLYFIDIQYVKINIRKQSLSNQIKLDATSGVATGGAPGPGFRKDSATHRLQRKKLKPNTTQLGLGT